MAKRSPNQVERGLIFFFLAMLCIWLIIDSAVGKDRLGAFLETLFPFMKGSGGDSAEGTPAAGSGEIPKPKEPDGMQAPTADGKPLKPKVPTQYPNFVTPMGGGNRTDWIESAMQPKNPINVGPKKPDGNKFVNPGSVL